MKEVFVISAVRTPIGSFGGMFSELSAVELGAAAIRGALQQAGVNADQVQEVFMGNVISSNLGQAPARQASMKAGIPNSVPCTTVNKVCSSGVKAIMFAAQSIMLGHQEVVIAGGMESMSNIPYYVPKARFGYKYGDATFVDGLARDGLNDAYDHHAMGIYADATAKHYSISREQQDDFAIQSYQRSAAATASGAFAGEIVPVEVPQRKGPSLVIVEDEEFKRVDFDKIRKLRPAFTPEGTVTAGNASTINDGAAALLLMSEAKVKELGLKPIAKILSFADAAHEPQWFTTAPTLAAPLALRRAGLRWSDVDFVEVNEAFSVVALTFNQQMGLSDKIVNVHGGAVSLGHPLGCSGARIIATLRGVLHANGGKIGLAAICNGGGGASSMVVEAL